MSETISPDELAYHEQVVIRVREAQAAMQSWAEHLTRKYELTVEDGIDPEGNIVRGNGRPATTEEA
jgi:hypothetical protein